MFFLHGLTPASDNLIFIVAAHQMIFKDDFYIWDKYWMELQKSGFAEAWFRILLADGKLKKIHALGKITPASDGRNLVRGSFRKYTNAHQQHLLDQIHRLQLKVSLLERGEEMSQSGSWQINLNTYETFYSDPISAYTVLNQVH